MESIKWYTASKSKEWDFVYFAVLFTCGENSAISHLIITDDWFLLEIEEKFDSDHRYFVENKYKALYWQMRREGGEDRKTSFNVMLFPCFGSYRPMESRIKEPSNMTPALSHLV